MFKTGQKLICVNDRFHPSIVEWCSEIPVRGEVYTIRNIASGTCPANGHHGPGFRFEELDNLDPDSGKECTFADWRFNPADEYPDVLDGETPGDGDGLRDGLRDPDFLVWLDRYTGEWLAGGESTDVRRRYDGWLSASRLPGYSSIPLRLALNEEARLVERPRGPLGPRPVLLNHELMTCWLTEEDNKRLNGAWHVSYGQRLILETIEKRIQEMPKLERRERWVRYWNSWASQCPISHRDLLAHRDLYEIFRKAST